MLSKLVLLFLINITAFAQTRITLDQINGVAELLGDRAALEMPPLQGKAVYASPFKGPFKMNTVWCGQAPGILALVKLRWESQPIGTWTGGWITINGVTILGSWCYKNVPCQDPPGNGPLVEFEHSVLFTCER